jgi:hypothetical protein
VIVKRADVEAWIRFSKGLFCPHQSTLVKRIHGEGSIIQGLEQFVPVTFYPLLRSLWNDRDQAQFIGTLPEK